MEKLSEIITWLNTHPYNDERIIYLSKHFQEVGEGMGRIVYRIDDDLVLKLAKDGGTQNRGEVQTYLKYKNLSVIPRIFYYDEKRYDWIVSEYVTPIRPFDFVTQLGMKFDERQRKLLEPSEDLPELEKSIGTCKSCGRSFTIQDLKPQNGEITNNCPYCGKKFYTMRTETGQLLSLMVISKYNDAIKDKQAKEIFAQYNKSSEPLSDIINKAYESNLCVDKFLNYFTPKQFREEEYTYTKGEIREYERLAKENRWFHDMAILSEAGVTDLYLGNFGMVNRNGKPYIVILDTGISHEINEQTKKYMEKKVTEEQLLSLIEESIKKHLNEWSYDNDLDYETIYDEAIDYISRHNPGVQSWKGIAAALGFRMETIGPDDAETLKDAIEDAMADC